ncbi:hypothetical protein Tco_0658137 [Tanacetum coccineum]
MVPFYIKNLGFTLELRSPSNFKTTGLIMQMLYCFVNNVHVDYADLLWEGLHYSLEHPSTLIPYLKFTNIIVSHYMTAYPDSQRRVHDKKPPTCDLIAKEIEKLVEGTENVKNAKVDSSTLRQNDNQNDPDTMLEPRNDNELPTKKVSQELVEEMSQTVDEAKLRKVGKPKEEVYSNSKIVQVIKTCRELGHEHKFITEIIARRGKGRLLCLRTYATVWVTITVYIRSTVIWERVYDFQLGVESYQQKVNLTEPTITFPCIEKYKKFSIIFELESSRRVKSYNNNVKHGYVTPSLSKEDVEYLQLFEEEIKERLKHLALAVLVTGVSQSRQHESRKSPTAELFDVDSGRISIVTVNTKEYHSDVLQTAACVIWILSDSRYYYRALSAQRETLVNHQCSVSHSKGSMSTSSLLIIWRSSMKANPDRLMKHKDWISVSDIIVTLNDHNIPQKNTTHYKAAEQHSPPRYEESTAAPLFTISLTRREIHPYIIVLHHYIDRGAYTSSPLPSL